MDKSKSLIYVPDTQRSAGRNVRHALDSSIEHLPKGDFLRAWSSLVYLFPGLHPDGYADAENGWPPVLRRFVSEVWRRAEANELTDEELYPSDATWAGICDRMSSLTAEERGRRRQLAVVYGDNDA